MKTAVKLQYSSMGCGYIVLGFFTKIILCWHDRFKDMYQLLKPFYTLVLASIAGFWSLMLDKLSFISYEYIVLIFNSGFYGLFRLLQYSR